MQGPVRHHHHRDAGKRGRGSGAKPPDPPITLQPGQVLLRLLCRVDVAGGVIGSSGAIVKQMERDSGARILVEDTVPSCHERVINIIGHAAVDRKIALEDVSEETAEVSQAQEGLMKVYERMLKVVGSYDGAISCRLLAGSGQVGAVMGKGGKVVDRIRKESGAKIRVFPKLQLPVCASPGEDLIQITGGVMAVKRALIAISHRLRDCALMASRDMPSYGLSSDRHNELHTQHSCSTVTLPGNAGGAQYSTGYSVSTKVDMKQNLGQDIAQQEVLFRLLCYSCTAGGIIGKAAAIVKALEKETGASIKFAAAVAGCKERVASIYAIEEPEPPYSPAQVASVRVFARSVEVCINQGIVSGETVTARLLVASDYIHCLMDGRGTIASDVSMSSGVQVQLLEGDLVPDCAKENDKVVQIDGEYENVKNALFQITGRLRQNLFSGLHSFDQMDHLGFLRRFTHPHSPKSQFPQMMDGGGNIALHKNGCGSLTSLNGLKHERTSPVKLLNDTVEVMVAAQALGSVYGDEGRNLARLKEISGAKVMVQEPCDGKNEGKVVVSGTPEQILVAQSLLQAFILNQP